MHISDAFVYTLSRIREKIRDTSDDYDNGLGSVFFPTYFYFSIVNYELVCLLFYKKLWIFWEYDDCK